MKQINIGLVGFGIVGSGVAEILARHTSLLQSRVGSKLVLKKIATRTKEKALKAGIKKEQLTASWEELVADPEIPVIVELMGGVGEAKKLILSALKNGKHVVTANKALLALHGKEIFEVARKAKLDICFEAAVGGGIPILRALREGFVANEIESMWGIINGTSNYILSEMTEKKEEFETVLKRAQNLGYAEQDPTFDIDGIDAAHKLTILISIAYGVYINFKKLYIEGIREISAFDIECAKRFGFVIKLLAITKKNKNKIEARVHPCMIPLSNPLANVHEAYNAILLNGDFVGPSLLYGKGAGKNPTASAVVGDLVEIGRNLLNGVSYTVPPLGHSDQKIEDGVIQPLEDLETEYYLRVLVNDRPGVLSKITGILGKHLISISSVYQHGQGFGKIVPIVILTHQASEKNMRRAVQEIARLKVVKRKLLFIRVEKN